MQTIVKYGNCQYLVWVTAVKYTPANRTPNMCVKMECITWAKGHQEWDLKQAETFTGWILSKHQTASDSCQRLLLLLLVNKMILLHCNECDRHRDRDAVCTHMTRNI